MRSRFISVDDHVQEPPDLWTSRLSKKKWGERIPHLELAKDGHERWVMDGEVMAGGHVAQVGALMGDRNVEPVCWDEVPAEAYEPQARLKAMDAAKVDASVLFPTVAGLAGEAFGRLRDPELELACVEAYNDWLIDQWAGTSDRFIPQCIVPISSPEATVGEIERAVAMGHKGVVFPALPMDLADVPHVGDSDYDPVWAACAALGVPLCLHAGSSPTLEYDPYLDLAPNLAKALSAVTKPVSSVYVLGLYLFTRVLLRHPGLRIVLAESALSWGLLYLEWADHQADHDGLANEGYDLSPSEMFRRQCYLNAWYDKIAPFAPYIGTENILWSTNFPLATSTWPRTQKTIDDCFEGLTEEQCAQVLWKNAASLYRL